MNDSNIKAHEVSILISKLEFIEENIMKYAAFHIDVVERLHSCEMGIRNSILKANCLLENPIVSSKGKLISYSRRVFSNDRLKVDEAIMRHSALFHQSLLMERLCTENDG